MTIHPALKTLAFCTLLPSPALACGAITPQPMQEIRKQARQNGLDERLIASVIWIESRFCHYEPGTTTIRTSEAGALGYGQLMPGTAAELGVNPRNPTQNIAGTARYLRTMWNTFQDWPLALAAYHSGPGNVRKAGGIPTPKAADYVNQVLNTYRFLTTVTMP